MKCVNCKEENKDNFKFCFQCGTKLKTDKEIIQELVEKVSRLESKLDMFNKSTHKLVLHNKPVERSTILARREDYLSSLAKAGEVMEKKKINFGCALRMVAPHRTSIGGTDYKEARKLGIDVDKYLHKRTISKKKSYDLKDSVMDSKRKRMKFIQERVKSLMRNDPSLKYQKAFGIASAETRGDKSFLSYKTPQPNVWSGLKNPVELKGILEHCISVKKEVFYNDVASIYDLDAWLYSVIPYLIKSSDKILASLNLSGKLVSDGLRLMYRQ